MRLYALLLTCGTISLLGAGEPAKPSKLTLNELELVVRTNQERKKMDLPPLKPNPVLNEIARAHSENMAKHGMMVHKLDNKEPFDRIREAGYKFIKAGENIAAAEQATLPMIMQAWMESKEHRANILLPEFTEIGIGIAVDNAGQWYLTQVFAKPKP